MGRNVAIGIQDFGKIIERNCFYVDKTMFIRDWWESGDEVTLITRPRRFGKTLTMSMVEHFFSVKYENRTELFENFAIWKEEKYRRLQGTRPVISLSFANVKERNYQNARDKICMILGQLYSQNSFLLNSGVLDEKDKEYFNRVSRYMDEVDATMAIHHMSDYLSRFYGKKVIILLDEYDTPMQEAWLNGYWNEIVSFFRSLFNAAFKTNDYLDTGIFRTYWANTSSNGLVGKLIREGETEVKTVMEDLLQGKHLFTEIDEQIVFSQLGARVDAIWSLFLTSGYLKVIGCHIDPEIGKPQYELTLTNMEVRLMFEEMIDDWFKRHTQSYNLFVKAMMQDDLDAMNEYMNRVAMQTFSYFDVGAGENAEPERFYHGFVLGLMVDLRERYRITSNRESGFGRYDIVLEPLSEKEDAIIIEFKVRNRRREPNLEDTLQNALKQIEEKQYETQLIARGIEKERIRKYGFAFEGKTVLIG